MRIRRLASNCMLLGALVPILALFLAVCSVMPVGASAQAPAHFWGIVTINGSPVAAGLAKCLRQLPAAAQLAGQNFVVTVTFTAPSDNFNAIGLVDNVPTGWAIQGDKTWCTPNANGQYVVGDQVQYVWYGPYSSGQTFTAEYHVTVPSGATAGSYTFTGTLAYHIGGGALVTENIAGNQAVNVQLPATPTPTVTATTPPGGGGGVVTTPTPTWTRVISVSPTQGPVMTSALITGTGFMPYSLITVKIGNYVFLQQPLSDATGAFTYAITVPGIAPGFQAITASDGTNTAETLFIVFESPTPTPTSTATSTSGNTLADIYGVGKSIGDVKYDQVMTTSGQTQSITMHMYIKDAWLSDKMKFRYEMTQDGTTTIMLMDLATKTAYSYLPDQNMAYKIDMSQAEQSDPTQNSDQIIPVKVGTETVDGKLCVVYQWTFESTTMKEWIWKEKSFPIRMEATTSSGTTLIEYKNIVFGTLSNDLFQLPAGVQIMQFPPYSPTATPTPIQVSTGSATDVSTTSATLNGNLLGLGTTSSVLISFEWGADAAYGNTTTVQTFVATGAFDRQLTGLAPGTTYHFRAKGVDGTTVYGEDKTFTTTGPTVEQVTSALDDAASAISQEKSKGFNVKAAEDLVTQAQQAFKNEDYQTAYELASRAKSLAVDIDHDGVPNDQDFAPTIKNIYIYAGASAFGFVLLACASSILILRMHKKRRIEKQKAEIIDMIEDAIKAEGGDEK